MSLQRIAGVVGAIAIMPDDARTAMSDPRIISLAVT